MNKIMAVMMREYLERVKRKSFFIGLILVPLFMSVVILLPLWLSNVEEETASNCLVIDEGCGLKAGLENSLAADSLATGELRYRFQDPLLANVAAESRDEALAGMLEEEILDWYVILPADLVDHGDAEYHGRIVSNFTQLDFIEVSLTELIRAERMRNLELDPALLEEISVRASLRTIQHKKGGATSEAGFESLYFATLTLVMILYMTILVFGSMIQRSILEDKNQHVTEVVLSSMNSTQFFTGKILGIGAVGLTQYLAWMLMVAGAMGFGLISGAQMQSLTVLQPGVLAAFVIFYVLGFLLYAGLFAAVGAMSTTDQEAQQMMQPIVMLLVVPLVAMIYIFQNPDSAVSVGLSLFPFTSPLSMFMRLNISAPPVWQLLLSYAILIVTTALIYVASGRIFRVGILMTGKKLSLVEAWRWVRQP